jgi:hypothetical protein
LQKAIRRGESELAQHAAATLLLIAPERLWRRCGAAAFEETGVADLETVSLVTAALAGKRYRATIGGDWKVASYIVDRMTKAPKCRAADDLLLTADSHPLYRWARSDLATKTTRELIQIATGGAISWPNPPGSIAVNVIGEPQAVHCGPGFCVSSMRFSSQLSSDARTWSTQGEVVPNSIMY